MPAVYPPLRRTRTTPVSQSPDSRPNLGQSSPQVANTTDGHCCDWESNPTVITRDQRAHLANLIWSL